MSGDMHPDMSTEIVLDTNVLLDWLVFANPATAPLHAELIAGRLHWVATAAMLQELRHVTPTGLLTRWQTESATLWQTVRQHVREVEAPVPLAGTERLRCRDRDDQIFIDLALSRRCRWLLTRDRALLKLARRALPGGVTVLTPEAWCAALAATAAPALAVPASTDNRDHPPGLASADVAG